MSVESFVPIQQEPAVPTAGIISPSSAQMLDRLADPAYRSFSAEGDSLISD